MNSFSNERGIALPITIFLVTLLTVMLAAALARAASDHEVADAGQWATASLAIAESGLNTYYGTQSTRPTDGDSTRINVTGGYADVVVSALQVPADPMEDQTFVIRSTGYLIDANQGSTPVAEHTVAQIAVWQIEQINTIAALVAANGNNTGSGADIQMDGIDFGSCGASNIAGVRIPSSSGSNGTYTGSPPIWEAATSDSVARETEIDWVTIRAGNFAYDYTDLTTMTDSSSYFINGDYTLTADGEGLLIVTGDLTGGGTFTNWTGVVLVGGKLVLTQNGWINNFDGLVITGLDEGVSGLSPVSTNRLRGSSSYWFEYNSCNVRNALKSFTSLIPLENTWIDNWATY